MRSFEYKGQERRSVNLGPGPTGECSVLCSSSTRHAKPGTRLYPGQPTFPRPKRKNQRQQKDQKASAQNQKEQLSLPRDTRGDKDREVKVSCSPQINLHYAEMVRVLLSPIIGCPGSLTMNASVNKIARTQPGWRCIVYRLPRALDYEKMSERDFVISLYFCKSPLSSVSSIAPLRIPDF